MILSLLERYIFEFVFPLLGFPDDLIQEKKANITKIYKSNTINKMFSDRATYFDFDNLYIGLMFYKRFLFSVDLQNMNFNEEEKNFVNCLVYSFSAIVESNKKLFDKSANKTMKNYLIKNDIDGIYIDRLIDCAIQRGICDWIINVKSKPSHRLDKLFNVLEHWTKKTYEGHRVCFGFLINPDSNNATNNSKNNDVGYDSTGIKFTDDFLDFLDDEYAAVISDGISSIIELDREIKFNGYHSIYENNTIEKCGLSDNELPYRFAQIISKYVINEKVGIFLLQNGDIVVSKSQRIYFIKRNGKWLNFKFDTFKKLMNNKLKVNEENTNRFNNLLSNIFSSTLDVSLSHSGGIISVIDYEKYQEELMNNVLKDIDILYDNVPLSSFFEKYINKNSTTREKNDIVKKLTKRSVLLKLLGTVNDTKKIVGKNVIPFCELDRKLRAELIGLDGACILDTEGNVISFGAIIQNDSGSTDGGRGSAAKKLSKFGGFAIKISTDGYIEVYINEEKVYSIK